MATIDHFLTIAAVTAGSGGAEDASLALVALDEFLATHVAEDQRSALLAASGSLGALRLSGGVNDKLLMQIDARLSEVSNHAAAALTFDGRS